MTINPFNFQMVWPNLHNVPPEMRDGRFLAAWNPDWLQLRMVQFRPRGKHPPSWCYQDLESFAELGGTEGVWVEIDEDSYHEWLVGPLPVKEWFPRGDQS